MRRWTKRRDVCSAFARVPAKFFPSAMNTRYLVLLLILGAIAAQCVYYYPQMPGQVASHFAAGGRPNGWMSRNGFFAFYGFMIVILTFSMFVLPLLLQRYQSTAINIPNRDYWLEPGRREQAYAMLTNDMAWFGNAILAFFLAVMQLVFEGNHPEPSSRPG